MAALPSVRSLPKPYVPVLTVLIAMVLALVCVGWLIFFINHISRSISVNHIVDRIAGEALLVIDQLMPYPRGSYEGSEQAPPSHQGKERVIVSHKSGYVRYVDVAFLVEWAKTFGVQITLDRRVGHFVPAGAPLLRVVDAGRVTPEREARLLTAIDIGPARTLQQDVEFGVIQIVDIALRAISPAVNDPTTAINCIDQLSRIMIVWTSRAAPPSCLYAPPYVLRVVVPWISYEGLLKPFYRRLSNTFGHIAHHNLAGFYSVFFERDADKVVFLEQTLSWPHSVTRPSRSPT